MKTGPSLMIHYHILSVRIFGIKLDAVSDDLLVDVKVA